LCCEHTGETWDDARGYVMLWRIRTENGTDTAPFAA